MGASYADAKRTILENAQIIANFRKRPVTTAPTLIQNYPNEPLSTFNASHIFRIHGEANYDIYVDGVKKGTLGNTGYSNITLSLHPGYNNFKITLKHLPSGTTSEVLNIQIARISDSDNDGIYDHIEEQFGLNPHSIDSDNDGYTDREEYGIEGDIGGIGGTAARYPIDSDGDGIIDALDEDSDNDGVSDKDERLASIIVTTIITPYILNGGL